MDGVLRSLVPESLLSGFSPPQYGHSLDAKSLVRRQSVPSTARASQIPSSETHSLTMLRHNLLSVHSQPSPDVFQLVSEPQMKFPTNFTARVPIIPFDQLNMDDVYTLDRCFKCPVCHKILADKYMFRRHYMIHTGEKPYACTVCPYRTIQKGDLKFHMIRRHQKTLP